jgi:hypothetical protein
VSENNRNRNQSNRTQKKGHHPKNSKQKDQKEKETNKKVPMRYESKQMKTLETIELKLEINETVEKVKLVIFEDGNDEQFLKLIKEFRNMLETYELWNQENGVKATYRNFCRCLSGTARDLWDQINIIEEDEARDELTFENHQWELTQEIIGFDAYHNQKEYLKGMAKPDGLSVKLWLNRMKNINSYLLLMRRDAPSLSEEDLISEVITPNLPSAWMKDFKILKLDCETRIRDFLEELLVIEDQVKIERKHTHRNGSEHNPKHLKNPCRVHNGGHGWANCRQNPKKQTE